MSNDQEKIDSGDSDLVYHNKKKYIKLHKKVARLAKDMNLRLESLEFSEEMEILEGVEDSITSIEDELADTEMFLKDINPKSMLMAEVELLQSTQTSLNAFDEVLDSLENIQDIYEAQLDDEDNDDDLNDESDVQSKKKESSFEVIENSDIKFSDLGGLKPVKDELQKLCDSLRDIDGLRRLGGKSPGRVLLKGLPGTAKTSLLKAIANDVGLPMVIAHGNEFHGKYYGETRNAVKNIFKKARSIVADMVEAGNENPGCIIALDEVEGIIGDRSEQSDPSQNEGITEILTQLDGIAKQNEDIIVLATTNNPQKIDAAAMRRFKLQIEVPLPDIQGRKEILNIFSKKLPLSKTIDLTEVARKTFGLSGANLESLFEKASVNAHQRGIRSGKGVHTISKKDVAHAVETEMLGLRSATRMSKAEKESTAAHEAGHAITGALLEYTGIEPLDFVTIVPHDGNLGVTVFNSDKENYSKTLEMFKADLIIDFAGRAAEELLYGPEKVSSGASSDIEHATDTVLKMIKKYGFSEKIGLINADDVFGSQRAAKSTMKSFDAGASGKLTDLVHDELKVIANDAYKEAKEMLKENAEALLNLSHSLMEQETVYRHEFIKITGIQPKKPNFPKLSSITPEMIRSRT